MEYADEKVKSIVQDYMLLRAVQKLEAIGVDINTPDDVSHS